ncbi:SusD/RagB family nutrient-binding outer membrane lipoprotein [Sphingobacterium faecale]|uniref:SusD/RagB family nutrient-binding outer membrane lipoprotein n=1 Tax=Sphingobacterium faecale TaxID=2803775 RepID=A0ABS1R4J3_9SPHI|nr:SusD/RagB family nutrient-binding outer membrane lipoprotein [Sphingobacterium faecale]MBL1409149.1 SusD/RagB family nutrient-binding outer membrane lipoprotein [Sphingobacterium faecale]
MKRNKLNILALLAFAGVLTTTSCTKDFVNINTNPVAYGGENFDPNFTLTTAQLTYTGSIDFAYDTWRANLIYSGTMIQGLSTVISYWAGDKYLLNPLYTSAYWERAYDEQVKPIVDVFEVTKNNEKYNNVHQIARIWKALIFARITDLYGDVPYSEAGQGYYKKILSTKYDKQQDIYMDLLKELDEATNALTTTGDKVTGDIIYGGDIEQWKRFGNSVMLRLAMRLTKVDESTAKAYATKAIGKTLASNTENAIIKHDNSGSRVTQNRTSQVLLGDGGAEHYYVKWSDTFINALKGKNDPRIKVAVTNLWMSEDNKTQNPGYITDATKQKGMPNGKDLNSKVEYAVSAHPSYTTMAEYSSLHPGMIKSNGITFILTYAESELLASEAAQRWGIGGSAATHYANAVKAGITFLGQYDDRLAISEEDASAFVNANPLTEGLKQISNQYWILQNTALNFYESWANWRRTGYPELTPVVYPGNATNGTIPRRFPYPTAEEAGTNKEYYKAAAAAVPGGDNLSGRVWWDKQ